MLPLHQRLLNRQLKKHCVLKVTLRTRKFTEEYGHSRRMLTATAVLMRPTASPWWPQRTCSAGTTLNKVQ